MDAASSSLEEARLLRRHEYERMVELGIFAGERVELVRGVSLRMTLYAEAGVREYWIVNVRDHVIEVHDEIVRDAYTRVLPYRAGSSITMAAFSDLVVAVDEVFGV